MIAKHRVTSLLYYSGSLNCSVIIEDYGFKRVNHFLLLKLLIMKKKSVEIRFNLFILGNL